LNSLFVFVANGVLLFLRLVSSGRNLFHESLWAEDGLFVLCNIKASAASCAFDSYSGFWSALTRMFAYVVSRFPIAEWALVNNLLNLIFLSSAALFAYVCIEANFQKKALPSFLVLAPSLLAGLTHEVLLVGNSIFSILGYYILLIFLYSNYGNWAFGRRFLVFCCLSLLYTVSNPLGSLLLLACLVEIFFYKSRQLNLRVFTLVVLMGNLIQGCFVLLNQAERDRAAWNLDLFKTLSIEFIKSFSLLLYSPSDLNYVSNGNIVVKIIYGVLLCFFMLLLISLFRNYKSAFALFFSDKKLLIPFLMLCLTLFVSVLTKGSASRFEVMTSLYAFLFSVGVLRVQKKKIREAGIIGLFLLVIINGIFNFKASELRATGPLWSEQLKSSQIFCEANPLESVLLVFPPNWKASVDHPYKVSEPTTENLECSVFLLQK
jgi:hypothetical protein